MGRFLGPCCGKFDRFEANERLEAQDPMDSFRPPVLALNAHRQGPVAQLDRAAAF